jgi:Endo-alpha-N-acetylgalactosaminidase
MFPRRSFVSSLIALCGLRSVPSLALGFYDAATLTGRRKPPADPILLQSSSLAVTLDAADGLPFRYTFQGRSIWGEDSGSPASAILCQLQPRRYETVPLRVASVLRSQRTVLFTFEVRSGERVGARFSLKYAIDGASLLVTMEDVIEQPGFELIEIALPNLATVRETDPAAWLAQGRDGGSFVRLIHATPHVYEDDDNFGRISIQLPMGAVGTDKIGCLMEVTSFMDGTETSVVASEGRRSARIGTIKVHRVHGGRCYNMNDGADAVCGTDRTPNLLVEQTSQCRLDFYPVEDPAAPWFPAAKLLRERMPATPTDYFDDKFLYLIAGKSKTESLPRTTFAQSRQLIRDIARLTDYAPQVAYISGWVYDGQDTGYPSEDVVNASLGSYEELMTLKEDSRELHTNVSVNVNYDDAYKSSPEFHVDFIAHEPNGAVWKARAWDGEDSYIVGMAKYVLGGWAIRRINSVMARYKLRDAMLIDALSWFTIRNDWDPKHPASGYKNLVDGKWTIIEEFRKRGIHICSEQFRYPMLGKLALTVDGPEPHPSPLGGEQIPLTAIVYRKSTIFGSSGGGALRPKQDLFWNSRPGVWYEHKTDRRTITDFYYLVVLPYNKVHSLDVERYSNVGTRRYLHLESESQIAMDSAADSYEVIWKGVTIASDEATTCPFDANRIAFYSRAGGRLEFPVPAQWNAAEVTARCLSVEGHKPFPVRIESAKMIVDAPAQVPIVVYAASRFLPAIEVSTAH